MFGPAILPTDDVKIINPIDRVKYIDLGWKILTSPRTRTFVNGAFKPSIMVAYKDADKVNISC